MQDKQYQLKETDWTVASLSLFSLHCGQSQKFTAGYQHMCVYLSINAHKILVNTVLNAYSNYLWLVS